MTIANQGDGGECLIEMITHDWWLRQYSGLFLIKCALKTNILN